MTKRVALICGLPAQGKSTSIRKLDNVLHINCEGSAKELTFSTKNKQAFMSVTLDDPMQLSEAFEYAEAHPEYHTVVVDGVNFLMDMYESLYVYNSADTRSSWQHYGQFMKQLMQTGVASSSKNVIFISHVERKYDEKTMQTIYKVPMKGAIAKAGIEAFFSTILYATIKDVADLEKYQNDLLQITQDEQEEGFKYVFQTRILREETGMNIRTPIGLFSRAETFIDSDMVKVIQRLNEYYE